MANNYKKILDEIIWSFSTMHLYENCPYAFYNKKICDDCGIDNAFAEIGRFGHKINELLFRQELDINAAIEMWVEEYDYNIFSYIKEETKEKKFYEFIEYLEKFNESFWDKYEVLAVEEELHWKIGRKNFVGFLDLLIQNKETGELILVDHKSAGHFLKLNGEVLKNQIENFSAYSKQMYLYCKPIYEKYKKYPSKIVWNHMFENKTTVIPFNESDYLTSIEWAKATIKKIYRDTKFLANKSYMMCYRLCNWRDTCEYLEMGDE